MVNNFDRFILNPLLNSLATYPDNNAFCINQIKFSYKELWEHLSQIRYQIIKLDLEFEYFGLVINDDIQTYASILALWMEGKAYVPLHPNQPLKRNEEIIDQVGIKCMLIYYR